MEPIVIKVLPYRGMNNEVTDGRKTKVSLFSNRIEYSVKYTELVKVSNDEVEPTDSLNYLEEDGVLDKDSIIGVVKYIKTTYTDDIEPYIIHYIDIYSSSQTLTFSIESEEDKNLLYDKVYKWKYEKVD